METQYWRRPVELELHGRGKYRAVTGTKHATEYLLTLWPVDHGHAYSEALMECFRALEGSKPVDVARRAFIRAANEANIPIRKIS